MELELAHSREVYACYLSTYLSGLSVDIDLLRFVVAIDDFDPQLGPPVILADFGFDRLARYRG